MQAPTHAEIGTLIHTAIEKEIERIIEEEKEALQERVQAKVRGSIGQIAAKVLNNFTYDRVGTELVIHVQFAFPETKP